MSFARFESNGNSITTLLIISAGRYEMENKEVFIHTQTITRLAQQFTLPRKTVIEHDSKEENATTAIKMVCINIKLAQCGHCHQNFSFLSRFEVK